MFAKIGYWFHSLKCESKSAFLQLKWHFYLLGIALGIALLACISADFTDANTSYNFFAELANGEGFPILSILFLLFSLTASFAGLLFSCINFYFYFSSYIFFGIGAYWFIVSAVRAIVAAPLWGILYSLFFLLILFCVWIYSFALASCRIYRNLIAGTGKCFRNFFRCNVKSAASIILPFWGLCIASAVLLCIFQSVLLVLMFK